MNWMGEKYKWAKMLRVVTVVRMKNKQMHDHEVRNQSRSEEWNGKQCMNHQDPKKQRHNNKRNNASTRTGLSERQAPTKPPPRPEEGESNAELEGSPFPLHGIGVTLLKRRSADVTLIYVHIHRHLHFHL